MNKDQVFSEVPPDNARVSSVTPQARLEGPRLNKLPQLSLVTVLIVCRHAFSNLPTIKRSYFGIAEEVKVTTTTKILYCAYHRQSTS